MMNSKLISTLSLSLLFSLPALASMPFEFKDSSPTYKKFVNDHYRSSDQFDALAKAELRGLALPAKGGAGELGALMTLLVLQCHEGAITDPKSLKAKIDAYKNADNAEIILRMGMKFLGKKNALYISGFREVTVHDLKPNIIGLYILEHMVDKNAYYLEDYPHCKYHIALGTIYFGDQNSIEYDDKSINKNTFRAFNLYQDWVKSQNESTRTLGYQETFLEVWSEVFQLEIKSQEKLVSSLTDGIICGIKKAKRRLYPCGNIFVWALELCKSAGINL